MLGKQNLSPFEDPFVQVFEFEYNQTYVQKIIKLERIFLKTNELRKLHSKLNEKLHVDNEKNEKIQTFALQQLLNKKVHLHRQTFLYSL